MMDENRKLPRGRQKPELPHETLDRLSEFDPDTGCYLWQGKLGTHNYAYISYRIGPQKRVCRKAATVAWEIANAAEVPVGLEISHTCANPMCVNPDHLLVETHSENLRRREWQPKGQRYVLDCPHCGQPKEQAKNGNRTDWVCKTCRARRAKEWREKTGYDFNTYRHENRDRINANRRISRATPKEIN